MMFENGASPLKISEMDHLLVFFVGLGLGLGLGLWEAAGG